MHKRQRRQQQEEALIDLTKVRRTGLSVDVQCLLSRASQANGAQSEVATAPALTPADRRRLQPLIMTPFSSQLQVTNDKDEVLAAKQANQVRNGKICILGRGAALHCSLSVCVLGCRLMHCSPLTLERIRGNSYPAAALRELHCDGFNS